MGRTAVGMLALGLALGASGCFGPIGNSTNECRAGSACVCSGIGNCDRSCPAGNCSFECRGTTNCNFDCTGGNCSLACMNTGNCLMACSGGGCDITCNGTGNCICSSGCESGDAGTDGG